MGKRSSNALLSAIADRPHYLLLGRVLFLLLTGADFRRWSSSVRYAFSRPSTEGRSLVVLVTTAFLCEEELLLVPGEARCDGESFFDGAAS